jgi:hypothetical protein
MKRFLSALLLAVVFAGQSLATDITSNLVAWYKFDEGSGTTATDSSGSGHDGTLTNSPTWISGKIGSGALRFTDTAGVSSDYIDCNSALIPATGDFTLAAWAKFTTQSSGGSSRRPFFAQANGEIALGPQRSDSGGHVLLQLQGGQLTTSAEYNDSAWHHYAATFSNPTATLYVDGSSVGTCSNGTALGGTVHTMVGRDTTNGTRDYAGDLDDVRIYTRCLSSGDVAALYAYTGATAKVPIYYYHTSNSK